MLAGRTRARETAPVGADRLVVVVSIDERMRGLLWESDGEQLRLVSELPDRPPRSSYVGAVMKIGFTD